MKNCLESVSKSKYPNFEVILVDNASTDGSDRFNPEELELSNFKLIRNSKNLGFAEGNNLGAREARGKYVVFLNSDTEIDSFWLKELVLVMESDESIGIAQSNLLKFDRNTIDSTGDFIDYSGNGCLREHGEVLKIKHYSVEVFSARGAAMMVNKQILETVGFFDISFFMLCEDVDLSWRIRLNGYKVVYVPKSIVYHFGSATRRTHQDSSKSYFYNTRNSIITLVKNYNLSNLFFYGSSKVVLQLILFLLSLPFKSKRQYNLSRLTAIFSIISNFRSIWRSRVKTQFRIRKVSDFEVKKHMLKKNLVLLEITWSLLYKNKIPYDNYLNELLFS